VTAGSAAAEGGAAGLFIEGLWLTQPRERCYLIKRLDKAAVVAKRRHHQHVVLLVYVKDRLNIDLGILSTHTHTTVIVIVTATTIMADFTF